MKRLDANLPPEPKVHPSPEELLEATRDGATREGADVSARQAILRHAAACATCSAETLHLAAFREPAPLSPGRAAAAWRNFGKLKTDDRHRRRRLSAWTLAFAAVIVGAIAIVPFLQRLRPPDRERGAGGEAVLLSPAGPLSAPPVEFVFQNASSRTVRVTVFDSGRNFDWTSAPTSAGRVVFPESERRLLKSGRQYFWTLIGSGEAGPVASFRIESRSVPSR
ncbi:MAG: hypothetical protein ACRD16_07390 [Thermoanaerobaculia bacterium]